MTRSITSDHCVARHVCVGNLWKI